MGGLAAAFNKQGEDAVSAVLIMLKQMAHRGADLFHVATPKTESTAQSLSKLETESIVSSSALGHNSSLATPKTKHKTAQITKNCACIFDGHFFLSTEKSDTAKTTLCLQPDPEKSAREIIRNFDGSYTFGVAMPDKIIAGRDLFGVNPLFYGENEAFCAVASERKALWTLGITNAKSFAPGNLALMNAQGFAFRSVAEVKQPPQERMDMEMAASVLQKFLLESVRERVSDVDEVAVAFSGGLDSTVLAVLADKCASKVNLITVGLKEQPELESARKAAEFLNLPLHVRTFTAADVENVLKKVLWLIEEPNVMKIGVAIPFFWTAEAASSRGCRVLLAGQGADELFGGYRRYLTNYKTEGVEAVKAAMFHDFAVSYETNFQRDNIVCAFHSADLRLPYVDREVANFALSLPINLKIESVHDPLRKRVLRQVAKNLAVPEFIAMRTKKAVQYATGVDKALRELAHREDLTQQCYIEQLFREIYPNWNG